MTPLICTVDVVLVTLKNAALHVALLRRDREPFAGTLALPGGYVHAEEDRGTRDAAARVLREKTGITSPYLEQLATFSGPGRDPRGWSISVAYYAVVSEDVIASAGHPDVVLVPVTALKGLPFDHETIIGEALSRLRSKSTYSSLPVFLAGERFTLPFLQSVYEAVLGEPINKVSFRRKMDEMAMLEPIQGAMEEGKAHRPAKLYRVKKAFRHALSLTERGLNAG